MTTGTEPIGAARRPGQSLALAAAALAVAAVAVLLAASALFRTGARPSNEPSGAVSSSEFEVRDAEGNLRGRWSAQGLSLADKNGRLRAAIAVSDEGVPSITLFNKDGRVRTVMALGSEDTPGLTLHDALGRVRARIAVAADGSPTMTTLDEHGATPAPAATPVVSSRTGRSR